MLSQRIFSLVSRLIFSRRARDYQEHHGSCEDAYAARIGPLHLEVNECFVLDHADARITIRIPTLHRRDGRWRRGSLEVGYVVCLGEDEIRTPGFYRYWQQPRRRSPVPPAAEDIPF